MSNKSRNLSMIISIYIYYILYLLHSELKSHFICSNCKLYVVSMLALSFHRIRLYKSANRGSRMEKVYKGIPDAKELFRIYGRNLFLQNIFVRVPILMDHPSHSANIWHADKTEVVTVPFEKIHLLNDFFNLLYLKL